MSRTIYVLTNDEGAAPCVFDSEQEAVEFRDEVNSQEERDTDNGYLAGPFKIVVAESPAFTDRELATVLAALRQWQRDTPKMLPFEPGDDRTDTHFEDHLPLTVEEIDDLCERINCRNSKANDDPIVVEDDDLGDCERCGKPATTENLEGEELCSECGADVEAEDDDPVADMVEEYLNRNDPPSESDDDDLATDESRAFGPRSKRTFE